VQDATASQGPREAAIFPKQGYEVLCLAADSLRDPHCDATVQLVAVDVLTKLSEGEPLSRKGYQTAIEHYAPITDGVSLHDECPGVRNALLTMLRMKMLFW
jgi:hypothetical protein